MKPETNTNDLIKQYASWISYLEAEQISYRSQNMQNAIAFLQRHIDDYTQRIKELQLDNEGSRAIQIVH